MYSSFHLPPLPSTTSLYLKNMYSCIFFTPLSFSLSIYQCIHPPLPGCSLYLNISPLTIHSSIRREGLKSMVTVQSGKLANVAALLGWGNGWGKRLGGEERKLEQNGELLEWKGRVCLCWPSPHFLFLLCRLAIDFPPSFTDYLAHNPVCFPHVSTHHLFHTSI